MSFTNKDGSLKSRVYESLTRLARREKNLWYPGSRMIAYWDGYKDAVYDTLKKLTELEVEVFDNWEAGAFEPIMQDSR